jgi:3-dehydroquinate dehydratase-2
MAETILVLNGPNLNMLGVREPGLYGAESLASIQTRMESRAAELGIAVDFRQSNTEGELVGWIQDALGRMDAIIINAGAYSHTSVAILDALRAVDLPVYEVHLSNIHRRESYRHHTYISEAAIGVICGLGGDGYLYALDAAVARLRN